MAVSLFYPSLVQCEQIPEYVKCQLFFAPLFKKGFYSEEELPLSGVPDIEKLKETLQQAYSVIRDVRMPCEGVLELLLSGSETWISGNFFDYKAAVFHFFRLKHSLPVGSTTYFVFRNLFKDASLIGKIVGYLDVGPHERIFSAGFEQTRNLHWKAAGIALAFFNAMGG